MKVGLAVPNNFFLTPYVKRYTDIFEREQVDYDIVYWNRHNIDESVRAKRVYAFTKPMDELEPKHLKLAKYFMFRRFVEQKFKETSYDRVFVFGAVLGVFLCPFLRKEYYKRYIVDIRDFSYEDNRVFYGLETKLLKGSLVTVISSEGYKEFLPPHDYVVVHNIVDWDNVEPRPTPDRARETIRIAYVGFVRFLEQNLRLIKSLANDGRFHLMYIGKNAEKLLDFVTKNGIANVTINSNLKPEDTMNCYTDADVVNNLYGNNTPALDHALSNRLYHAAQLKLPILVCPNTYMERISHEYKFGITVDLNKESFADSLYQQYHNIDWRMLRAGCDAFLEKVNHDNLAFEQAIRKALN
jgi:glycosyltransferase involved in cell wall biosynthesis